MDRRGSILKAAGKLFAKSGYENTTVRQIADEVNILSGSLYHHFATKDEMLLELVREPAEQIRDNALRISRSPFDAERRLIALVLLELGELTRNQAVHAIISNERRLFRKKPEFSSILQAKVATYAAWRRVIEDGVEASLFRPDLDVYLTISTILKMLRAAAEWYAHEDAAIAQDAYTLDQMIQFHLSFIMAALRIPSRAAAPIPRSDCEELATFQAADPYSA